MKQIEMNPITMFATPESMEDLQTWITKARDPYVTTAAIMMFNLLVSKYDMYEKKEEQL